MSRQAWKLPYISLIFFKNKFLIERIENKKEENKMKENTTRIRNSIIPSIFLDKKIKLSIYNGIWYLSVIMSNNMSGCKFGEFSYSKRSDKQTHLKRKRKKKPKGVK